MGARSPWPSSFLGLRFASHGKAERIDDSCHDVHGAAVPFELRNVIVIDKHYHAWFQPFGLRALRSTGVRECYFYWHACGRVILSLIGAD